MWVALVAGVKELSKDTTETFRKSRTVFFIILGISTPIQLVFGILYAISDSPWATYVYYAAVVLCLIGAIIWSSVYVIKLHSELVNLDLPVANRKNYLVGATNIIAMIFILANVMYVVRDSGDDHLRYLEGLAFLRFTELALGFTIVFSMENYLLLGVKKNIKLLRKACHLSVSSSSQNMSGSVSSV